MLARMAESGEQFIDVGRVCLHPVLLNSVEVVTVLLLDYWFIIPSAHRISEIPTEVPDLRLHQLRIHGTPYAAKG
jgi:hypothetical protein